MMSSVCASAEYPEITIARLSCVAMKGGLFLKYQRRAPDRRGAGRPCLGNQTWLVMLGAAMRLWRMSAAATTAARRLEGLDLLRMLTLEGFHLLRVPLL
jgi:hypothetical protein